MPRWFLSLLVTTLGSLFQFRIHLVGLLTFYTGESYHHFLLVCAFSPALTCVISRFFPHEEHLSGGGGRSPTVGGQVQPLDL